MTRMLESQARAVMWPFSTPRRAIGDLLDRGLLTGDDLRHAARIAYSRKLKAACVTLLDVLDAPRTCAASPVKPVAPIKLPVYPTLCPICGGAVQPDHRWDSVRHGAGWRCEPHGAAHCLQLRYLPLLKAFYAPDMWVIPPSGDYVGLRRRDQFTGPIGYWPSSDH